MLSIMLHSQVLKQIPGGPKSAAAAEFTPLTALLSTAAAREEKARNDVLYWTFRTGHTDADGKPIRYSQQEVAERLKLPVSR